MAYPPYPDADPDGVDKQSHRARNRSPRWVTVAGVVAGVALLMLMVVLHVTGVLGPGEH